MHSSRSDLAFASLLAYSPHGAGESAVRSKETALDLKANRVVQTGARGWKPMMEYFALRLTEALPDTPFPSWFDGACLVPVPRSAPLQRGALWPAAVIAQQMVDHGVGDQMCPLLERAVAVPKSAYCEPGQRPGPDDHARSLKLVSSLPLGVTRIVLVDDVVTRGASLLGAAMCLDAALGPMDLAGFAAIRTISNDDEFRAMLDPCTGHIRRRADRLVRRP